MPPSEGQEPRALAVAAQVSKVGNARRQLPFSKRPNHRIYGLNAGVLPFAPNGGRGFGSVFRHQLQQGPVRFFAGRGLSHWRRTGIACRTAGNAASEQ